MNVLSASGPARTLTSRDVLMCLLPIALFLSIMSLV